MSQYARASRARGLCDRCGFNVLLSELREEVTDGRRSGLKVCETCFDPDHPIYQRGRQRIIDPQTLQDPRPDADRITASSFFGWAPIGNPGTQVTLEQGNIAISTED